MKRIYVPTVFFTVFFLLIQSCFSCKSYQPSFEVSNFINKNDDGVVYIEGDSYFIVMPDNTAEEPDSDDTGIIFYPGGLVEYQAYLPLMEKLAQKGVFCILVKMPFDFAFMDFRAAGRFIKLYPEVEHWYMAGHSLGGAMAASYLSRHKNDFDGLILLAAYSNHNISDFKGKVISIYGSNDGVLNMKLYKKYLKNLPSSDKRFTEIIIEGANHAQFASYGAQKGDYMSSISCDEQQERTALEIAEWIGLTTEKSLTGEIEK